MLGKEIATRYARALFLSAKDRGYLEEADRQLGALQVVLAKDLSLVNYLTAPQVTDQKKREFIGKIFGSGFERGILEFMLLLARKRREGFIPLIIDEFRELVADDRGVIRAQATSARTLTPELREKLISELKRKTGKDIELVETIDKRTLGGVRVTLNDQALDGTVANALVQLKNRLEALEIN